MRFRLFVASPMVLLAAVGMLVAAWIVLPDTAQGGSDIVVNTPLDNQLDDGLCSLPEAIIASNTNAPYLGCTNAGPGADRIRFNLPGTPPVINVTTELPEITDTVDINGGQTLGPPRVELRGPGGSIVSGADGLTIKAPGTRIVSLVINSFRDVGILVLADDAEIIHNYIGTDSTGTIAQPNAGFGVQIKGNNTVFGGSNGAFPDPCGGVCNLVSGNTKEAILVDIGAQNTVISGNFIGTDATGTQAIDEGGVAAIVVKGTGTRIGGEILFSTCTGSCNLIAGSDIGILTTAQAVGTNIDGNYIGVNVTGTASLEDGEGVGVWHQADHTIIGQNHRNVISGFNHGIFAETGKLFVHRNFIGTDAGGTEDIGNTTSGITLTGGDAVIIDQGNLISGNGTGVIVGNTTLVSINGNLIGTQEDGVSPLGNFSDGVRFIEGGAHNVVGNTSTGNVIAFNGGNGVRVSSPTAIANLITGNSIHHNLGLGIDNFLGGNAELAPPVITDASVAGASGTACANCKVELFSDDADEGGTYEGQALADANGDWTFVGPFSVPNVTGPNVTATNWDSTLFNTSEFSAPVIIVAPTPSPTPFPDLIQGDTDCDETVEFADAMLLLEYVASLFDGVQDAPCPDIGETLAVFEWGDVNCDGVVNARDALYVFVFLANLPPIPGGNGTGCTHVGDDLGLNNPD